MTAALDRAVANALGLKSVNNCEKWSKTMIEDDDDIQVYKRPWVGLTDEEIDKTYLTMPRINKPQPTPLEFARAVEQLLKERNA
jgi:hypothetical protein